MGSKVLIQEPQNHVIFCFDESLSMQPHSAALVKLFDNEVAFMAQRSKDFNQETRVSVYLFSSSGTARPVIYDMDVLRLPSIKGLYHPNGNTALCDATVLAVEDLKMTPTKYGQHSFWLNMFTDGFENASTLRNKQRMPVLLSELEEEWTVSIFVPNQISKKFAIDYGFPKNNIDIWDTSSVRGMEEVGKTVRAASESYFTLRSTGAKGTKSLFSFNSVSTDTIKKNLVPMNPGTYKVLAHPRTSTGTIWIRDLVERELPVSYKQGFAYYELVKNEHIQPSKDIAIEQDGRFYIGKARDLLGLPDHEVKVGPDYNASYKIFVQSKSVNRNVIPGQRVMYLTGNSLSHLSQKITSGTFW